MMKQVRFESRKEKMYGYAHVPAISEERHVPAIILCHGFTGACHENSRLFVHLAKAAEENGFYVLRSDFVGSGSSDADFAEYTHLSGWAEDILSSVGFLQEQPEVDPERIGVLGISFGAGAALTAGSDSRIKAVVGWASVIDAETVFRGIFGNENWDALESGRVRRIEHVYSGSRFAVTDQFVEDVKAIRIVDCVCRYQDTALMLVQGGADAVIDPAHAPALADKAPFDVEYYAIPDEDHSFLVHEQENIEQALSFFRRAM